MPKQRNHLPELSWVNHILRLAKLFPPVGIVLGLALIGVACYYAVGAWVITKVGFFGYLIYAVILVPIGWVLVSGITMFRIGLRLVRGEDADDIEDQMLGGAVKGIEDAIRRSTRRW